MKLRKGKRAPSDREAGGARVCRGPASGLAPEDDTLLAAAADALRRRGLLPVARLCFESGRPLSFLGAQGLHVLSPLAGVFWPDDRLGRLAGILERREHYERFLQHLARDGEDGP